MAEETTDKLTGKTDGEEATWDMFEACIRRHVEMIESSDDSLVAKSKALSALARAYALTQSRGEEEPTIAHSAPPVPKLTAADMAQLPDISPPAT